jgi:hypothetical protein
MHRATVSSGVGPFRTRLLPLPAHDDAPRDVREHIRHACSRLGRGKEQLWPAWRAALHRPRRCVPRRGDRGRGGRREHRRRARDAGFVRVKERRWGWGWGPRARGRGRGRGLVRLAEVGEGGRGRVEGGETRVRRAYRAVCSGAEPRTARARLGWAFVVERV